jgi:hypothetical protein
MYQQWLLAQDASMMMMEPSKEEATIEEVMEENEDNENVEEGEEFDVDNLSMSDMPDDE